LHAEIVTNFDSLSIKWQYLKGWFWLKKVLILGATGMLGSTCMQVLCAKSDLQVLGTTRRLEPDHQFLEFDAAKDDIKHVLEDFKPEWIINCIGIIKPHIDENKPDSIATAKRINSEFPKSLAAAALNIGAKVIQIATDCVFSGESGLYSEADSHDATDVYGRTKSDGEALGDNFMNIRCSIIGPEIGRSTSLLEWFRNQAQNAALKGFTDHLWNGITTYHFARLCLGLVEVDAFFPGVHHFIPADIVSKARLLNIFAESYNRNDISIAEIESPKSINRTLRTNDKDLNKNLWKFAGYAKPPTIEEMIKEQALLGN
jgi:dTDP-4-dehydrorhamnose reductase